MGLEGRREQIQWCEQYLDDIESDLSVFHRVDDYLELDGPRFFRYALRLGAYQGVIGGIIAERETREQQRNPRAAASSSKQVTVVSDEVMLQRLANEGMVDRGAPKPAA